MRRRGLLWLIATLVSCAQPVGGPESIPPDRPKEPTPTETEPAAPKDDSLAGRYAQTVTRIREAAHASDEAYLMLRTLSLDIGARPVGSEALGLAVEWAKDELTRAGHDNVHVEPVEVSAWRRGAESLVLHVASTKSTSKKKGKKGKKPAGEGKALAIIGLGGSVPTPAKGIRGEVVVVHDWKELEAADVKDRIVFFDVKMEIDQATKFPNYGYVVPFRRAGASRAAAKGAAAVLVRSLTTDPDSPPHTGAVDYAEEAPKVPAAALSWKAADELATSAESGTATVTLKMASEDLGSVVSGNVLAEIVGSEAANEIVVIGGHIDAWDAGQGAHDNGAGVVTAMGALNLLRQLDLQPRRTIRLVLWTDEERTSSGSKAYAAAHESDRHVAVLESDTGGAAVIGFSVQTKDTPMGPPNSGPPPQAMPMVQDIVKLLGPEGVGVAVSFFSGSDSQPLVASGALGLGIIHDPTHYFDMHHSDDDVFTSIERDAIQQSVAAAATAAFILADTPGPIPAGATPKADAAPATP